MSGPTTGTPGPTPGGQGDDTLSATVLCLQPGASVIAPEAGNLDQLLPEPARIEAVRGRFDQLGFATTDPVAGSFSITGPRALFERTFATVDPGRFDPSWLGHHRDADLELPVDAVRAAVPAVADDITAVFFTAPPDFGPGNP